MFPYFTTFTMKKIICWFEIPVLAWHEVLLKTKNSWFCHCKLHWRCPDFWSQTTLFLCYHKHGWKMLPGPSQKHPVVSELKILKPCPELWSLAPSFPICRSGNQKVRSYKNVVNVM